MNEKTIRPSYSTTRDLAAYLNVGFGLSVEILSHVCSILFSLFQIGILLRILGNCFAFVILFFRHNLDDEIFSPAERLPRRKTVFHETTANPHSRNIKSVYCGSW